MGQPGIAALMLAAAAVSAFLAHEPLLVLLGQRGPRAARENRVAAVRWFSGFAAVASLCAATAFAVVAPDVRAAFAVPAALAATLVVVISRRAEHTVVGEVLSALTLSSAALPIALASGASSFAARSCALAFAASFAVGVVCVHGVIANTRRPPAMNSRFAGAAAAIGAAALIAWMGSRGIVATAATAAVAPSSLAGLVLVLRPPPARKLRVVGWTLVAVSIAVAIVLVVGLRGSQD
jgi:hypothetical protein